MLSKTACKSCNVGRLHGSTAIWLLSGNRKGVTKQCRADSPTQPGTHFPKIVRFTSTNGGHTAANQTTILNMVGAMGKLAGGDHSVEIPATDKKDEIGLMARAVVVFKETA